MYLQGLLRNCLGKSISYIHNDNQGAVKKGITNVKYLSTEYMIADVLTKGLNGPKHRRSIKRKCWK
jgi:hypothetical protein